MRYVAIVGLGLLLAASNSLAASKKPMTADEMKALLANGVTIGVMDLKGGAEYKGSLTINADGTQAGTVTMTGKPPMALSGTWKLKGAQFCRVLKPVSDKEVCETWVKSGDKEITVMIGKKAVALDILP